MTASVAECRTLQCQSFVPAAKPSACSLPHPAHAATIFLYNSLEEAQHHGQEHLALPQRKLGANARADAKAPWVEGVGVAASLLSSTWVSQRMATAAEAVSIYMNVLSTCLSMASTALHQQVPPRLPQTLGLHCTCCVKQTHDKTKATAHTGSTCMSE